jgi:predicted NBD/HSP70 family sugar kinase
VQACDVLPAIVGWRPPASLSGLRFAMVNDAAAALAEECHDAPADVTAAVVMAGTGIGAALLTHGRRWAERTDGRGSWAASPSRPDRTGVRTLDQLASGQALVTRLGSDGATVRARVEGGDVNAREAVQDAGTALGLGLAALIDLVNPALVWRSEAGSPSCPATSKRPGQRGAPHPARPLARLPSCARCARASW